jgi:hypothetical protein
MTAFSPYPVIISSQDCNTLKSPVILDNVIILDRADIQTILPLIQNGKINRAKKLFYSFYGITL